MTGLQHITKANNDQEAIQILNACKIQESFVGGKIIRGNQVQAIYAIDHLIEIIPDDCRLVFYNENHLKRMGF